MNEWVSTDAHRYWPECTIVVGSALLCFGITPNELGYIQQHTGAYTVELSAYDRQQIKDCPKCYLKTYDIDHRD